MSSLEIETLTQIYDSTQSDSNYLSNIVPKKLSLLSHIRPGIYFDLIAEIKNFLPKSRDDQMTIVVSDYTENNQLSADIESLGLEPWLSNALLFITCWDANILAVEKLCCGQIVCFKNLHCKSINGRLVASLHNNARSEISLVEDPKVLNDFIHNRDAFLAAKVSLIGGQPTTFSDFDASTTTILNNTGPISSISDILRSDLICFKWFIKGRACSIVWPNSAEKLIQKNGISNSFIWIFRLKIQDFYSDADFIEVTVAEDDAVFLLNGLKPIYHPSYYERAWDLLLKLTSSKCLYGFFAIKSCTYSSGLVQYRLFGTKIQ